MSNNYGKRGVSADKEDVHAAVKNLDKGIYANTFSRIYPDYLGGNPDLCNLMSSDGTGTKSTIAYLYWKETGDLSVWRDIAVDAIVMNLDDLLCVGATGPFLYSSIINRNKNLISGDVIAAIIDGAQSFFDKMKEFGIEIHYMGGETADLGDSVRTITVDGSMTAKMPLNDVINTPKIQVGDVIVGFESTGQASYETAYNAGIGSNGLTSARHDVLSKHYFKHYPESFDPNTDPDVLYIGSKKLTDDLPNTPLNVGRALLSPTKTYAPLIKVLLDKYRTSIHSMIHCTGGAQTKVLHFINDLKIVKNKLFETPPLFKMIQEESKTDWKEMYKVFNMGHRMELYVPQDKAQAIIAEAARFDIKAQVIGHVEAFEGKQVDIHHQGNVFSYS